jgi:hypothetical protein
MSFAQRHPYCSHIVVINGNAGGFERRPTAAGARAG